MGLLFSIIVVVFILSSYPLFGRELHWYEVFCGEIHTKQKDKLERGVSCLGIVYYYYPRSP